MAIKKIKWFDSNVCVGRPMNAGWMPLVSQEELLREMDGHSIAESLVWHIAQHDGDPYFGNELLKDWLNGNGRIHGCLALLPPFIDAFPGKNILQTMKRDNICAVTIFPGRNNYDISALKSGSLMGEIVERRIPVVLSNEFGSSWQTLSEFMQVFPHATCIVSDIGVWGQDRYLWPLLDEYPNLHVETGMLSIEAGGLECGVKKFGSSRFIFGTGFPRRYMGGAMADLLLSDIPETDKADIAGLNLERLVERIEL